MEDGREKHRLCGSLLCLRDSWQKKKKIKQNIQLIQTNKTMLSTVVWSDVSKFPPLGKVEKPDEAWSLMIDCPKTSQVLQKTVRIFRLPHPPTEMFPFSFLKNPPDALLHLARVWNGTKTRRSERAEWNPGWRCCHEPIGEVSGRNVPFVTSQMPHFQNCVP